MAGLPDEIAAAYLEARKCAAAEAYAASEVVCRKVLMQVAVANGAALGKPFTVYVDHLAAVGLLTQKMLVLADTIRLNANRAAHELPSVSEERSLQTLKFCTQLLRLAYELDSEIQGRPS